MNRAIALTSLLAVLACGCSTVNRTTSFNGVRVDDMRTPVETVEIENSGWYFLSFIPIASGDYTSPNSASCCWFTDTVKVKNNIRMLKDVMIATGVRDVANLTSHRSDEKYLMFVLTRRAYHTSAVLLKPEEQKKTENVQQ